MLTNKYGDVVEYQEGNDKCFCELGMVAGVVDDDQYQICMSKQHQYHIERLEIRGGILEKVNMKNNWD